MKKIVKRITKIVKSFMKLYINNLKIKNMKDSAMLFLNSIGLSLCLLVKKEHYSHQRCGP